MTVGLIGILSACIGLTAGLLGSGGSIFTLLLLIHLAGLDLASAITTSMAIVAGSSGVALVPYARARAVLWRDGFNFGAVSMIGAYLGGRISTRIPSNVLMAIFAATVIAASATMLRKPSLHAENRPRPGPLSPVVTLVGLLIGSLTGMVGLGGGFAVVPLLVCFVGVPIRSAVGTALFVRTLNTLAGLAGHSPQLAVHWPLAVYVGLASSVGSLVGARVHGRLDMTTLRRAFAVLTLVVGAAVLASAFVREARTGRPGSNRSANDARSCTVGAQAP